MKNPAGAGGDAGAEEDWGLGRLAGKSSAQKKSAGWRGQAEGRSLRIRRNDLQSARQAVVLRSSSLRVDQSEPSRWQHGLAYLKPPILRCKPRSKRWHLLRTIQSCPSASSRRFWPSGTRRWLSYSLKQRIAIRRRNELRVLNGYATTAETENASLAATDVHRPINGIQFQLIRRFPPEDAVSECRSDKYQQDCKHGCPRGPHRYIAFDFSPQRQHLLVHNGIRDHAAV
jgi:hypothetical protein